VTDFDVVVVGGGPAGSVCAAALGAQGRRVALLERDRHPRFHLGESLLPASLDVLSALGILDRVRARFLVKYAARFVDGAGRETPTRYLFSEAFGARWDHAFQVPRDEFDELVFRHAGTRGAELREGWEVTRVVFEAGRAVGVEARDDHGVATTLGARFVVDASGRDAIVARSFRSTERIALLDRTALYTHVRGAWRDEGPRAGDVQIVVFGDAERRGWLWFIPFADGRTSVGAVVSPAWTRAHRDRGGPAALFGAAVEEAPAAKAMLDASEALFEPRATADFSFRVRATRGPGWLALGDAAGFIDPLFSTGVHLAMHGALSAGPAIDAWLADETAGEARLAAWERDLRGGSDLFVGVVQAFYAGGLTPYLFAELQHPFLRRAISSMLTGYVFDDTRWTRAMRARFPVKA